MLGLMVLLFIFSSFTTSKEKALKFAGYILVYTVVLLTCFSSVILILSLFFRIPKPINELLTPGNVGLKQAVLPNPASNTPDSINNVSPNNVISPQIVSHVFPVGNGAQKFQSISNALSQCENGDTIELYNGSYDGADIDKDVTIIGIGNVDQTRITDKLVFRKVVAKVEGITFDFKAILADDDANVTFNNCVFNCSDMGIDVAAGTLYVKNAQFNAAPQATANAGVIALCKNCSIFISKCQFTGLHAALVAGKGAPIQADHCIFKETIAAISFYPSVITIRLSDLRGLDTLYQTYKGSYEDTTRGIVYDVDNLK
jgi:hypothetical protein